MPGTEDIWRSQKINVMLSCMLMFAAAGDVSFGVFSVPIEHASVSLTAVWSSSLGLVSTFAAPVMIAIGFILDNHNECDRNGNVIVDHSHSIRRRLRIIALPASLGYLTMALAVPAIHYRGQISVWLLRAAAVPLAVPTGVAYMTGIHTLLSWLPTRPALAMSFCSASYGMSQFVLAPLLSVAILELGVEVTLLWTAVIMCVITIVTLCSVRYPSWEESIHIASSIPPVTGNEMSQGSEGDALIPSDDQASSSLSKVDWKSIFCSRSFAIYMLVLLFGRAAYALLPFFFELGASFGVPAHVVVIMFQVLSACAIVYSFLSNALIDNLSQSGQSVVQQAFVAIFIFQAFLFLCLYIFSATKWSTLAMLTTAALIILLESQTSLGVILGREVFGVRNCTAVYGVAGGLSIGIGEGLFTWVMGLVEKSNLQSSTPRSLVFEDFFLLSFGASILGAICVIAIQK